MAKTLSELKKKVDKVIGLPSSVVAGDYSGERILRYKTRTGVNIIDIHVSNSSGEWRVVGWSAPGRLSQRNDSLWRKLRKL